MLNQNLYVVCRLLKSLEWDIGNYSGSSMGFSIDFEITVLDLWYFDLQSFALRLEMIGLASYIVPNIE